MIPHVHTTKRRIKVKVTLAFSDNSERLLAVIEDNHLNIEALRDIEIFELFWADGVVLDLQSKKPVYEAGVQTISRLHSPVLYDEDPSRQEAENYQLARIPNIRHKTVRSTGELSPRVWRV